MRAIDEALYTKINGDTDLLAAGMTGVHRLGGVPRGAKCPYVVFGLYAPGTDSYTLGGWAGLAALYVVKAVGLGLSAEVVQGMADRLHSILTNATLTVSGRTLLVCRREREIEYAEQVSGNVYQHAGGVYRIEVA